MDTKVECSGPTVDGQRRSQLCAHTHRLGPEDEGQGEEEEEEEELKEEDSRGQLTASQEAERVLYVCSGAVPSLPAL